MRGRHHKWMKDGKMTRTCQRCGRYWVVGQSLQDQGTCDPPVFHVRAAESPHPGAFIEGYEEDAKKLGERLQQRAEGVSLIPKFFKEGRKSFVEWKDGKVVKRELAWVVKAAGPTTGKGVFISTNVDEALDVVRELLDAPGKTVEVTCDYWEEGELEGTQTQGGSAAEAPG